MLGVYDALDAQSAASDGGEALRPAQGLVVHAAAQHPILATVSPLGENSPVCRPGFRNSWPLELYRTALRVEVRSLSQEASFLCHWYTFELPSDLLCPLLSGNLQTFHLAETESICILRDVIEHRRVESKIEARRISMFESTPMQVLAEVSSSAKEKSLSAGTFLTPAERQVKSYRFCQQVTYRGP